MDADTVLLVVCVIIALGGWTTLGWWLMRGPLGTRRPHRTTTSTDTPPPGTTTQWRADWADRAQMWPALNAENALLTARMSGRIGTVEYRDRLAELARRCEPRATDLPGTDPAEPGTD